MLCQVRNIQFCLILWHGSYSRTWPLLLNSGLSRVSTECLKSSAQSFHYGIKPHFLLAINLYLYPLLAPSISRNHNNGPFTLQILFCTYFYRSRQPSYQGDPHVGFRRPFLHLSLHSANLKFKPPHRPWTPVSAISDQ